MEVGSLEIAEKILAVASTRGYGKSTCPSEIARMLFPENWRKHMKAVVDVAIELQQQEKVVITQKGLPVEPNHIRGPIRIKIA